MFSISFSKNVFYRNFFTKERKIDIKLNQTDLKKVYNNFHHKIKKISYSGYDLLNNAGFILVEIVQILLMVSLCFKQIVMNCFRFGYFSPLMLASCLIIVLFLMLKPILSHVDVLLLFLLAVFSIANLGSIGFAILIIVIVYNSIRAFRDMYNFVNYFKHMKGGD